jgi:hypothetical protein
MRTRPGKYGVMLIVLPVLAFVLIYSFNNKAKPAPPPPIPVVLCGYSAAMDTMH